MIYKSLKPFLIFLISLIILHLRFTFPSLFLYLPVRVAPSFVHLYIQTLPKFETLAKLKSTNNILLIYILVLTYPHFSSTFYSFFIRSLFVLPSFIVRLLFVFCSLIVYLPVRLAPSFVYLPVVLRLSVVLRAHTLPSTIGIIGIIVLITDIVNISFSSP